MKQRGKRSQSKAEADCNAVSEYTSYYNLLSDADKERITAFLADLRAHCDLTAPDNEKMCADFENAILYYSCAGIPLSTALFLLDVKNLGGFYARPPLTWYPLDDAAKVYPISMKHGSMSVFRISAYMRDAVVPELLQLALTFTIKRFPTFAVTVSKGFFWHYLNASKHRYAVCPEGACPCEPMSISRSGAQPFRVLYFGNRISAEFFHIITDGTGGMVFLRTLIAEYVRLRYCVQSENAPEFGVLDINDIPSTTELVNEFSRVDLQGTRQGSAGFIDKPALQIGGELSRLRPCRALHFVMNAQTLIAAAKRKNATVTAYVLALIFIACKSAMDSQKGNIAVQVPVNMRKYYPSSSLRNFSMYCKIMLSFDEITDVESIIDKISKQLAKNGSKEEMNDMVRASVSLVSAVRFVPLFIKSFVARLVYGYAGEMVYTTTLSNIGVVKLPRNIERYVRSFDCVLGTVSINRTSCSMVTYGNVATLSVAKNTHDPSFEDKLFELLCADDVEMHVEGSCDAK